MLILTLKKLVSRFFFPVPMILILLGAGTWLILWKTENASRRKTIGKWLLIGGIGYFLIISFVGSLLLNCFKRQYPVFTVDPSFDVSQEYVIAVAGVSYIPDASIPETCRFNEHMLLRLWEAGRIAHLLEAKAIRYRIVVSLQNPETPAEQRLSALKAYFAVTGLAPERVELVDGYLNTRKEILAFSQYPGRLILVSNAYHIPRIMLLAKKNGLKVIPAPVGVPGKLQYRFSVLDLVPSGENVNNFRILVYELLGMFEVKLTDALHQQ